MAYLCLSMFLLFLLLFFVAPKKDFIRWYGIFALLSSFWAFAGVLNFNVLSDAGVRSNPNLYNTIRYIKNIFLYTAFSFWPYAYLLFAVHYSGIFSGIFAKNKLKVTLALASLPLFSLIVAPLFMNIPFKAILIWVLPFSTTANFLFIYTLIIEKDRKIKIQKLFMFIITVPFATFNIYASYIIPAYGIPGIWSVSPWTLIIAVLLLVVFSTQKSFLGFKLKVEKETYFNSAKSLAGVLNHSLKDKVNPILLIVDNIKSEYNDPDLNVSLNEIAGLASNIRDMIERINLKTKEIILNEEKVRLSGIIDDAIGLIKPSVKNKNITFRKDFSCDVLILCDVIHMKEVMANILNNAADSIENAGEILIKLYTVKNNIVLAFSDSGSGIKAEDLPHITEPFWSTKRNLNKNYGLGLTYCSNVMSMYGSMDIQSEWNKGTTVSLAFSRRKVIEMIEDTPCREVMYANN